jgi:phenylalanyl-tRNA synthetase alpha chain
VDPGPGLAAIEEEARRAIAEAASPTALADVRARFLGKKGSVSAVLRGIGALAPAERTRVGEAANAAKARIEALVRERRDALERAARDRDLAGRRLDVTLPGRAAAGRSPAPDHADRARRRRVLHRARLRGRGGPGGRDGVEQLRGAQHPARPPRPRHAGTFFVEGGHVLRTHTSPVQIRAMTGRRPPFRFIVPGRVYRNDRSPRHSPMFHQVEGFMVDEHTSSPT